MKNGQLQLKNLKFKYDNIYRGKDQLLLVIGIFLKVQRNILHALKDFEIKRS